MSKYLDVDKAKTVRKIILWGKVDTQAVITGKQAAERFSSWNKIGYTPYEVAKVANGDLEITDSVFEALIKDANAYAQLETKGDTV
ncbi:hypothetical protein BOO91_20175 [Vibrio navarrensis]|uniref:Uncharacterized protein n=1 Tax=Vibrio navarrensis TaxID=29495 RepID=A0AAJ4IH73_9VIBR|nr:hypothetical protein [Vibrio navarrensis]MBE3653840.1 hypothetical protein [Vibrio navarrensis]MBE3663241.1 hypothetical protein [Vibrio navarrensis]QPL56546.1 hypothetical protein I3X05_23930 [Vibrio navarrensis]